MTSALASLAGSTSQPVRRKRKERDAGWVVAGLVAGLLAGGE